MNSSYISNNKKDFAGIVEEEDYALTHDEQMSTTSAQPRRTLIYFFAMVLECFVPTALRR